LRKEGRKCRGREIWEMKERRNTKYIEQRAWNYKFCEAGPFTLIWRYKIRSYINNFKTKCSVTQENENTQVAGHFQAFMWKWNWVSKNKIMYAKLEVLVAVTLKTCYFLRRDGMLSSIYSPRFQRKILSPHGGRLFPWNKGKRAL
jgi:hypothetical protein